MIKGIEHAAIASPDPAALSRWYCDTLGFTVSYQSATTVIVRAQNGYMVEITTSAGERAAQTMKSPGLRHLAIAVDEFDTVYAGLKSKGVSFVDEPAEKKGVKVVYFTDPEGNYLHLLQRAEPLP